ncbi:PAS domain S-box protein, partial [Klebsiella pneumoniae]
LRLHVSGVRAHDGKLRYTVSHVEDITVRHRQELELRASEQRYRTVVESSPAIIARFDRDRRLTYLSPAFENLTGIPV